MVKIGSDLTIIELTTATANSNCSATIPKLLRLNDEINLQMLPSEALSADGVGVHGSWRFGFLR